MREIIDDFLPPKKTAHFTSLVQTMKLLKYCGILYVKINKNREKHAYISLIPIWMHALKVWLQLLPFGCENFRNFY
jgi:hypothetical protein